jgi:hypothetical protein
VIIYIIDIKNITFAIPENNPVVWADLDGPETGIIAGKPVDH